MKKILLYATLFFTSQQLYAQAPERMSYQAVIRNNAQELATNQNVGMQISILEGSANGTPIYVETHSITTNDNGLASTLIGAGNVSLGDFSSIDWSANTYFIKTETDPTGGTNYTITGVSQMMSVPYALYAKTSGSSIPGPQGIQGDPGAPGANGADGVDGLSAYEHWLNLGNVGTEQDFINSLTGPTGNDGASAYDLWLAQGNTGTQADFMNSLVGPQGPAGPGAVPAGSDMQVGFNDGGAHGADAEFVYDKNTNSMAIGTSTINPSAALEINSTTGSLLLPRLTETERDALTPTEGMLMFNSTSKKLQVFVEGQQYSDGNNIGSSYPIAGVSHASTFMVGQTAPLSEIEVTMLNPTWNPNTGATGYRLRVYDAPGGTLLAISNNTVSLNPGDILQSNFDFTGTGLTLNVATSYYFEVKSNNSSDFYLQSTTSDDYPDGAYYQGGSPTTTDVKFKVVTGTPSQWVDMH